MTDGFKSVEDTMQSALQFANRLLSFGLVVSSYAQFYCISVFDKTSLSRRKSLTLTNGTNCITTRSLFPSIKRKQQQEANSVPKLQLKPGGKLIGLFTWKENCISAQEKNHNTSPVLSHQYRYYQCGYYCNKTFRFARRNGVLNNQNTMALDAIQIPSFFTLSPSHQFLAACIEY